MKYKIEIHYIEIYNMVVDLDEETDPEIHEEIILEILRDNRYRYFVEGKEHIVSMEPLIGDEQ